MTLVNDKIKMISCSNFRLFLKKMIKDKIEKQWSESFVENLNFVMVSRNTIKRRYEDKGIDLIKLLNDVSYYKHVKKRVNPRGNLEFQYKQ